MSDDGISSTLTVIGLNDWRDRLIAKEKECPWPGPRPLRRDSDAASLLVGRGAEQSAFLREVRDRRMVFLTGETGVGKTSLLELGLAKELGAAGYVVGICRDWSGSADAVNPIAFLASKVAKSFADHLPDDISGAQVFWSLDGNYQNNCVIVLDQFEELLRDSPLLTEGIFAILGQLNHRTELKIVISFRSEYLQKLKPLESRVKPFTTSHFPLSTMKPEFAIDVVTAPNARGREPWLEESCAQQIVTLWQDALKADTQESKGMRGGKVGLLHLQAMLYVLWFKSDGQIVTAQNLSELRQSGPKDESDYGLFVRSLKAAVDTKIEHCCSAAANLEEWLVDGTTHALARTVRHLSSGGYKLIRGIGDLAFAALEAEIKDLEGALADSRQSENGLADGPVNRAGIEALIDCLIDLTLSPDEAAKVDLLAASIPEIAQAIDEAMAQAGSEHGESWSSRLHRGVEPRLADPAGVSSGAMLGMAPANILIEELRRFAFAVEWLRSSDLARLSTPGAGGANLALIHDGFATALTEWSSRMRAAPAAIFASVTAPRGGEYIWGADVRSPASPVNRTREQPLIVVNQRWKGAWVSAKLAWVTFVSCDFRGAGFGNCTFEGVTFVNCLMDGVLISDSTIRGVPAEIKEMRTGYDHPEPEFRMQAGNRLISALNSYRGTTTEATELHIPLPGLAAEPAQGASPEALTVPNPNGGLSIVGGRLSALTMRKLTMESSGSVSFSHVAGSGIDIVEQNGGKFTIEGSALRHLTISPHLNDADMPKELSLTVKSSNLVQTWISDGIKGTAELQNSAVIQFWNDSPDFTVVATNSPYYDLVGVIADGSEPLGKGDAVASLADTGTDHLASRFRRMVYRRDASRRDGS